MRRIGALVGIAIGLTACAAGLEGPYTAESPAGFWVGLWHGAIALITLLISFFTDVRMYALDNTGVAYDLGFFLGLVAMAGGGAGGVHRARRGDDPPDWDGLANEIETQVKRDLAEWVDAGPTDANNASDETSWGQVERKIEATIRESVGRRARKRR